MNLTIEQLVLAIDGHVAAGKSSLVKWLANELGLPYIDTGSVYRSLTWLYLENGVSLDDTEQVKYICPKFVERITVRNSLTCIDGKPVGKEIRTQEISTATSIVSEIPEVREHVMKIQHACMNPLGVVGEGRDLTSVVYPKAIVKCFVTAAPEVRARRRYEEFLGTDKEERYETVLEKLLARDKKDMNRKCCPLVRTPDSTLFETDNMSIEGAGRIIADMWRVRTGFQAIAV